MSVRTLSPGEWVRVARMAWSSLTAPNSSSWGDRAVCTPSLTMTSRSPGSSWISCAV